MPRRGTKKEYTMKRKLFTLFVAALALVCLVLPMTVGAADDPTISLVASTEKVYRGDTFTVDVVVANNPGFWGPTIIIDYDNTKVEFVSAVKGDIYAAGTLDVNPSKQPVQLSINPTDLENNMDNGTLITLTFKVTTDAELGNTDIKIAGVDAINVEESTVDFATVDTAVDVYGRFDTAVLEDATVAYDGTEKSLTVTGAPAVAAVTYTYDGVAITGVTNAGTYAVAAKITAPYYDDKKLTATLTVEKAKLTPKTLDVAAGTYSFSGVKGADEVMLDLDAVQIRHTELDEWFADKVISYDKLVEFHWGKTEQRKAEIIAIRSFSFIRFRWLDDENERDYFEIKMTYNELTSDYVLEITDFAEPDEVDDMKELWESQVAKLRRTCGF